MHRRPQPHRPITVIVNLRRLDASVPETTKKQEDTVPKVRELTALLAIICYFAGWDYANFYFRSFGLSLHALDIPAYHVVAYSGLVFVRWYSIAAAFAIIGLFYLAQSQITRLAAEGRWSPVVSLWSARHSVAGYLTFFATGLLLVSVLSFWAAKSDAERTRADAPGVQLHFKNESPCIGNEICRTNQRGELRLFTETDSQYVVFSILEPSLHSQLTYIIGRDSVDFVIVFNH